MIKFARLFGGHLLGISFIGLAAFVIQEIPYMLMPLIQPEPNPIMTVQNGVQWVEKAEGIAGMLTMFFLMLTFRDGGELFPLSAPRDRLFFSLTALMILVNFAGWILYFLGFQYGLLIVISQFAAVPLYYLFFGLWQRNYLIVGSAAVFFVIHTVNGCMKFLAPR